MRLIDADELRAVKFHALPYTHIHALGAEPYSYELGWNDAIDAIMENAPTVDPYKHGRWIEDAVDEWAEVPSSWVCSECGYMDYEYTNYCHNCGARMDEVKE